MAGGTVVAIDDTSSSESSSSEGGEPATEVEDTVLVAAACPPAKRQRKRIPKPKKANFALDIIAAIDDAVREASALQELVEFLREAAPVLQYFKKSPLSLYVYNSLAPPRPSRTNTV